jgi:hypothetical protein
MPRRAFRKTINPEKVEPITEVLNGIFTERGSKVGTGHPIAFSVLFARDGRLVARDNAQKVGVHKATTDDYITYFRNSSFQSYLTSLRDNKKKLHDLHLEDDFGPVLASSYRFKSWLLTIKNYDSEGTSRTGNVGAVNTLIVLSPLRDLKIETLEEIIDEMDIACATALMDFPNSLVDPARH